MDWQDRSKHQVHFSGEMAKKISEKDAKWTIIITGHLKEGVAESPTSRKYQKMRPKEKMPFEAKCGHIFSSIF